MMRTQLQSSCCVTLPCYLHVHDRSERITAELNCSFISCISDKAFSLLQVADTGTVPLVCEFGMASSVANKRTSR